MCLFVFFFIYLMYLYFVAHNTCFWKAFITKMQIHSASKWILVDCEVLERFLRRIYLYTKTKKRLHQILKSDENSHFSDLKNSRMMASVTLEELCQYWKSIFLLSQLSGLRLKKCYWCHTAGVLGSCILKWTTQWELRYLKISKSLILLSRWSD